MSDNSVNIDFSFSLIYKFQRFKCGLQIFCSTSHKMSLVIDILVNRSLHQRYQVGGISTGSYLIGYKIDGIKNLG